jgi:hypothetical protein
MRSMLAAALLGALVVTVPSAQSNTRPTDSLTRGFQAGGRISMDLSAGEYHLIGSPDNAIRMTWIVEDSRDLSRVRRDVTVRGQDADLRIEGPEGNQNVHRHFEVEIAVPSRSDLEVDLSAGEMHIRGITGNKNISLLAGELNIDVGRASDYRRVDASVWAGEINGGPFGRTRGGLFRSFDWDGPGQYRLEAHLKAGEINLR